MQRRTVLSFLLLCTAAAAVLWLVVFGRQEPVAPPGPVPPGPHGVGSPELGRGPGAEPGPESVPADAPTVVVTVTARERFVPPPVAPEWAFSMDGQPLPCRVLAGVGAGYDAEPRTHGVALLAIDYAKGRLLRQVSLDPAQPTRTEVGAPVLVHGRVDDERRQPLAGARVWFGEVDAGGERREAVTDDEGAFALHVPMGQGVPFVVVATGKASRWRTVAIDRNPRPLVEVVQPGAELAVQLAARALDMRAARCFVTPARPLSTGAAQWPFWLQAVTGGAPIDERGRAQLVGLPRDATLNVVVRHPLAPSRGPQVVRIAEERVRAVVPLEFAPRTRRGLVVDERGEPIANALVVVRPPRSRLADTPSLRLLPPHLLQTGVCRAITDASGRFEVGVPDGEQLALSVRADGHAGREFGLEIAEEAPLVLPRWRAGEAALRILPPAPGIAWRVRINLGDGIDTAVSQDQAFRVSLPYAGRYAIEIRVDGGSPKRTEVSATATVEIET